MVKGVVVHYLRWQVACQSQVLCNAPLNDLRPQNLRHDNAAPLQAICAGLVIWLETLQELIHFLDKGLDCFHGPVEGFLLFSVQF